jgi:hypothetical protein
MKTYFLTKTSGELVSTIKTASLKKAVAYFTNTYYLSNDQERCDDVVRVFNPDEQVASYYITANPF